MLDLIVRAFRSHHPRSWEEAELRADMISLEAVMLQLMGEVRSLFLTARGRWSAGAVKLVEATSWTSPDELSNASSDSLAVNHY
jgi:hypothetical protein